MQDELTTEHEARKEQAAEEAAARIKRGDHWLDWLAVGEGRGDTSSATKAATSSAAPAHLIGISAIMSRSSEDWLCTSFRRRRVSIIPGQIALTEMLSIG